MQLPPRDEAPLEAQPGCDADAPPQSLPWPLSAPRRRPRTARGRLVPASARVPHALFLPVRKAAGAVGRGGGHEAFASRRKTRAACTAEVVLVADVGDRHRQLADAPQIHRRPVHAVADPLPPPCQRRFEPPSERRTVRGKAPRAHVTIAPRGSCIAGMGSFTPQPSRNGKHRVRTKCASPLLVPPLRLPNACDKARELT